MSKDNSGFNKGIKQCCKRDKPLWIFLGITFLLITLALIGIYTTILQDFFMKYIFTSFFTFYLGWTGLIIAIGFTIFLTIIAIKEYCKSINQPYGKDYGLLVAGCIGIFFSFVFILTITTTIEPSYYETILDTHKPKQVEFLLEQDCTFIKKVVHYTNLPDTDKYEFAKQYGGYYESVAQYQEIRNCFKDG